jgi:hypothetical protein
VEEVECLALHRVLPPLQSRNMRSKRRGNELLCLPWLRSSSSSRAGRRNRIAAARELEAGRPAAGTAGEHGARAGDSHKYHDESCRARARCTAQAEGPRLRARLRRVRHCADSGVHRESRSRPRARPLWNRLSVARSATPTRRPGGGPLQPAEDLCRARGGELPRHCSPAEGSETGCPRPCLFTDRRKDVRLQDSVRRLCPSRGLHRRPTTAAPCEQA